MAKLETAYFGGGCFWCTEASFKLVKGIEKVTPGYAGGEKEEPTYEEVSSGETNHAEVVKLEFDPKEVSYSDLLRVFFVMHDPTTLNRQGNDVGTQYRSIILFTNGKQKDLAKRMIMELEALGLYENRIVTEVKKLNKFYPAEDYHQNYFIKHPERGYCQVVIRPKIEKLMHIFEEEE